MAKISFNALKIVARTSINCVFDCSLFDKTLA